MRFFVAFLPVTRHSVCRKYCRCSIFAWRGAEIWKHERAQELLYDGAGDV